MRGSLRQTAAVASIGALVAASSACSNDPRSVPATVSPLPSTSSPSSTPSGTAGMADEGQIRTLYEDFTVRNWHAESLPARQRRKYLAQWMIDPALSRYTTGMNRLRKQGEIDRGTPIPHVLRIKVDGKTAQLSDCSDQSHIRTVTRKGKVVDRGHQNTLLVVSLKLTPKGWRVSDTDIKSKDRPCSGR